MMGRGELTDGQIIITGDARRSPISSSASSKIAQISAQNISLATPLLNTENARLFFSITELEKALRDKFLGVRFSSSQPRSRSKIAKLLACDALGYDRPKSFPRSRPRFPGQLLDIGVYKSDNFQLWNDVLNPAIRHALIKVDERSEVTDVRDVTGGDLASWGQTDTLTTKLQARGDTSNTGSKLVAKLDNEALGKHLRRIATGSFSQRNPKDDPTDLLPIAVLHERLRVLVGASFPDPGEGQDRLRGAQLHKAVCSALGYPAHLDFDNGQFPDVRDQLLECKLQTSSTIDLGITLPDSRSPLPDLPQFSPSYCRYLVAYATIGNGTVTITGTVLTNGAKFFTEFTKCKGKKSNSKRQIRIPSSVWD